MVEDGTMMTCGPSSPSSSRWARKAMAWMVLPRPCRQCHRLHRTMLHGRVVTTGEFSHTPSPLLLPWYNGAGCLGVKHPVTYFLTTTTTSLLWQDCKILSKRGLHQEMKLLTLHFCQKSHQTLVHTKLSYSHLQFQLDKHSDRQHTLNMEMHTFQTSHSPTTSYTPRVATREQDTDHFIGQDSVELLGVHDAQPVEADQLVGLQLKPVTHSHPHVTPPWHKA